MKNLRIEAVILAIGLALTGYFVKAGIDTLATRDRVVTVKGLAEMEVPADKVTWPLMYKSIGNDLPALYSQIEATNQKIQAFLTSKGIDAGEISINAPERPIKTPITFLPVIGSFWIKAANIMVMIGVSEATTEASIGVV